MNIAKSESFAQSGFESAAQSDFECESVAQSDVELQSGGSGGCCPARTGHSALTESNSALTASDSALTESA